MSDNMKRGLKRKPQRAKAMNGSTRAWWYEHPKSIDVAVMVPGSIVPGIALISRCALASWLERTS